MTDSIKPPGSAPGPVATPAAPAVGGAERFRAELDTASAPAAAPADRPSAASAARLDALVADVRSGALPPAAVIDRLIEQHLSTGPARALSPVARAELERALRARFEDDPNLLALTDELGRARP
jgi:hypothetical protein